MPLRIFISIIKRSMLYLDSFYFWTYMEPKELGGTLWYSDQHAKAGSIKLNIDVTLLQQSAFTLFCG